MENTEFEKRAAELMRRLNDPSIVTAEELEDAAVEGLYRLFPHYSWVGIYWLEGEMLKLGKWRGRSPTEHVAIPLGKGICGAAAASGKIENIPDVGADSRYISCFVTTKSEIVVPIEGAHGFIGEIDIDSETPSAFGARDEELLTRIASQFRRFEGKKLR